MYNSAAILAVIFLPSYVSPAQSSLCWQNNMINKCYLLFQILRDSIYFLIIREPNGLEARFARNATLPTFEKCRIISQCQNTPLAGAKYDE